MTDIQQISTYSAFAGSKLLCQGELSEVVLKIKKHLGPAINSSVLIFNDDTGRIMDFNFQGSKQDVMKRLEVFTSPQLSTPSSGPGRPRLGVVLREVSLLPNHWEWLANQPGGASATLRRLVEESRSKSSQKVSIKQIQERTYRVMSVLAGDLPGYEEALRALYKKDSKGFNHHMANWPKDVQQHLLSLSKLVFEEKS